MEEAAKAVTAAPGGSAGWLHLFHILGVLVYAGGVILESRLLALLADAPPESRAASAALGRRLYLWLVLPFGALMVASGLYLLIVDPEGRSYFRQAAFHMKLTLVAALLIVEHVLVIRPLKGLAKGTLDPARARPLLRAAHPLVLLLVFGILLALFVLRGPAAG